MERHRSKAIAVSVFVVVTLLGCEKSDSLGSADLDAAAGGASGSGGATSTGGKSGTGGVPAGRGGSTGAGGAIGAGGYIITATGPNAFGGAGGSAGTGGSSSSDAAASYAELCTTTGGTVASQLCCIGGSDFPDYCMVGACSCAPTSSKMVNTCSCPSGSCFDRSVGCKLFGDAGP